MTHKCFIEADQGIYGKRRFEAFRPSESHPFAVYKEDGNWKVGHLVTGMVVMSIISQRVRREKKALLGYIARMEADVPDALAMMWCVTEYPVPEEYRAAGQVLVDWARAYK